MLPGRSCGGVGVRGSRQCCNESTQSRVTCQVESQRGRFESF